MLIILIVKGLEHTLEVAALLDYNSLQLMIMNNGYAKVVADRVKIYYLKFVIKLLFKGVNSGSTADDFNIIYID